MPHPTIDLTQQPDVNCIHPAYNCVKYCFLANDFQTQVGTKAQFTIEKDPVIVGHNPGLVYTIAGQDFTTGTVNSHNTINTAPVQTAAQYAQNFKEALEFNSYIYNTFTIEIIADQLIATAREVGELDDFIFDYTASGTPPVNTDTNGLNDEYLENYRLIVEIWQETISPLSELIHTKISSEAYTPNSDGTFCINIGEKIAPLLESRFVFDESLIFAFADETISGRFFIRYGESYSDTINSCDVELRDFVNSDNVGVINSAFQRQEQAGKTALMCDPQFMTNAPKFTEVCESSEFVLWINLNGIIFPNPTSVVVKTKYIITYTDGTTDTILTAIVYAFRNANQIFAISAGATVINLFSNPLKTVDTYEVRINQVDGLSDLDFGSHFFKRVPCCDGDVEFYFLNEFGGYDTILFSQVDTIELSQSNAVFQQFTDCEQEDTLRTGKKIIDQTADDVYSVTSKFLDNYETRRWIREFISSPIKAVKMKVQAEDDILSKVIIPPGSVQYFSEDDNSLFLRVDFILNESINLQKN